MDWLGENGAAVSDSIRLHDYTDGGMGTGVIAVRDIKKGDSLFRIPKKILLSYRNVTNAGLIRQTIPRQGASWNRDIWAVILELENTHSFWRPYFDMLPERIATPLAWSADDLAAAEGSHLWNRASGIGPSLHARFLRSSKKMMAACGVHPSEERFHFAGSLISAYSFTDAEHGRLDLVPLADLLNHSSTRNNARLYYRKGFLEMLAHTDIAAGEQIFNTFGRLSNTDLLLKYGFVEGDNPNKYVIVDDDCLARYLADHRLGRIPSDWPGEFRLFVSRDPDRLFRRLGRLGVAEADFLQYKLGLYRDAGSDLAVSSENQRMAVQIVQEEKWVIRQRLEGLQ